MTDWLAFLFEAPRLDHKCSAVQVALLLLLAVWSTNYYAGEEEAEEGDTNKQSKAAVS